MSNFLTALPLAVALGLTGAAAYAQTTDTTQTETPTETETETDAQVTQEAAPQSVEDELTLGEDAQNDPELGKTYTKEIIGAWEMRCIKTGEEVDPCQMYQLMEDAQGNPVSEVSLFRLPGNGKAQAGATVVVPLETSLPQQLTMSVDGSTGRRYPFSFCNPVGCYVRLGLTGQDVAAFKAGNEAKITIVPALAPDQKVELTLSLSGFTASYDQVSVIDQ